MLCHLSPYRLVAGCFLLAVHAAAQDKTVLDTRGPAVTPGMTVLANAEGVQAPGYQYTKPNPVTWTATFINPPGPSVPNGILRIMRKEVDLDQEPTKVEAWMTSGSYLLFINGKQASRGPADAGNDFAGTPTNRWFYDCRDFTGLLHKGKNVLAVEAFGNTGFLFQADIHTSDGKTMTVVTDTSWKGKCPSFLTNVDLPPLNPAKPAKNRGELFDAAAEPVGWQDVGFDDSTWGACTVGKLPYDDMIPSEIPPVMEARYPIFNITAVTGGISVPDKPFVDGHSIMVNADGEFTVHFDKIMSGRCGIAVKGVKGTTITLDANETDIPGGRIYEINLRDGVQYFEARDYYALGSVHVTVHGVTQPIEIMDVSSTYQGQPISYQGSFTCSDDDLNKLWKSCRWSTQICLMTHHLDSPQHNEPIGDYGDYVIEDLVTYNAFGDNPWLARQDLRKFSWILQNAKYQTFHTSYALLWLQALVNYYNYTGDKSVVEEVAPTVHGLIDQFTSYIGKNGIISEAPNYMFMDWVATNGVGCHHPPAVIGQGYMTAFFYQALANGIRVSELTDDPADAQKYADLRKQIAEAYNRELWNAGKGLYRDGKPFVTSVKPGKWLPADKQMETFSVQNNSLAVLYDLAPPDRQQTVINNMMKTSPVNATPYFMHYVLSAIAHAGLFDQYGVDQMHTWHIVPETQTCLEMGTRGDHSHGWIGTPTYQMSSVILGIKPTGPAFSTFDIRPNLGGLTFAKGSVPTSHGKIEVDWARNGYNKLTMKVTVPPGTQATVAFPVGSSEKPVVSSNGKMIWNQTQAGGTIEGITEVAHKGPVIEMQLAPGSYEFDGTGLILSSAKTSI